MKPEEFITVATQLLAGDGEGRLRSAVSRAYFVAFHIAREFVQDCGVLLTIGPESHKSVRWCLANAGDPKLIEAAGRLESLRLARNKADYDLSDVRFSKMANAKAIVQQAVEFATVLQTVDPNTVTSQVQAYAAKVNLATRTIP